MQLICVNEVEPCGDRLASGLNIAARELASRKTQFHPPLDTDSQRKTSKKARKTQIPAKKITDKKGKFPLPAGKGAGGKFSLMEGRVNAAAIAK
jgi:hypothetical protein